MRPVNSKSLVDQLQNSPPKIIQAELKHLDDLSSLFDGYRQFYNMKSDIKSANNYLRDRLSLHDSIIYMLYQGNHAQAFAQIYPSFSSVAMQRTWTLNDLYVDRSYRNQGAGRLLLEHVLNKAKENSVFSVKLITAKDNHTAKSLYQSCGFQINTDFDSYSIRP
jgi:ribosomal protein S18 acetylase RimI-like enzyme